MRELFKSKLFWIIALIAAGVVFIFEINIQKTYIGGVDLLLLPKSEKSAADFERIISNAERIPLLLSFYNKLAEDYDMGDETIGLPDNQRKELWNSKITAERIGKSGIIHIEVAGNNQLDAEILSKQVVKSLITAMSRYYNIKNDLDMRIVDGPIVTLKNELFNIGFFLLSLFIGAIAGMILYFISKLKITPKKSEISFPSMTVSKRPEELKIEIENKIEEDFITEPISKKEQPISVSRKAFAPENLPIGNDFVLSVLPPSAEAIKEVKEVKELGKELKSHEATEEEIKRRLNKLLGTQS